MSTVNRSQQRTVLTGNIAPYHKPRRPGWLHDARKCIGCAELTCNRAGVCTACLNTLLRDVPVK